MKPSDIQRIADSTIGAQRFFERERERCLRYTNSLYGRVCDPKESFLKEYASAFLDVVARTHAVASCRANSRGITLQFPRIPPPAGRHYVTPGEIVIHLPESRDAWASGFRNAVHRDFPWVQWHRPGDTMVFRRRQISPRENAEQIFARCSSYFAVHALSADHRQAA